MDKKIRMERYRETLTFNFMVCRDETGAALYKDVTVRDEADEDRLVDKIMSKLADEIEEADDNMGEEDLVYA